MEKVSVWPRYESTRLFYGRSLQWAAICCVYHLALDFFGAGGWLNRLVLSRHLVHKLQYGFGISFSSRKAKDIKKYMYPFKLSIPPILVSTTTVIILISSYQCWAKVPRLHWRDWKASQFYSSKNDVFCSTCRPAYAFAANGQPKKTRYIGKYLISWLLAAERFIQRRDVWWLTSKQHVLA